MIYICFTSSLKLKLSLILSLYSHSVTLILNTAFSLTLSRRNSKDHCLFYTALRCPADRSTPSLPLAWSSRFEQYGYTSFKLQEVILLPAHQGDATYSAEMADFEI